MGFYDRDYYRSSSPRSGLSVWSVTTWLIVINVAVFVLDILLSRFFAYVYFGRLIPPIEFWGHFSAGMLFQGQVWRLITFQFLHANMYHLFFNMLALYFFGPMIENYLGSKRFLAFYLICGIAGAVAYLILMFAHVLIASPWVLLVGASAGIFGILIAAARVAPDATVMLLFPPIPMKLRTLAWVFIGIAIFTVLTRGQNAGGEAAHLGGAAMGWLLIENPRWLNVFNFRLKRRYSYRPRDWENYSR